MEKVIILILLIMVGMFCCINFVLADCRCSGINSSYIIPGCTTCAADTCNQADYPNCTVESSGTSAPVKLDNPLGEGQTNISVLIGKVINAVLGIVGSLALVMFIYGGFVWMTAAGNTERVTLGKNVLIWATIGLVVIFASYAIVNFIIFEGIGAP